MPLIAAIDADRATLDLYEQLMAEAAYDTMRCEDAATAYERIRKAAPDAVILDLRLSTHDAGWAVLRSLKLDVRLWKTPVLICTADTRIVRQCAADLQSLGCVVLAKPFDIDTLLTALRREIETAARTCPAVDTRHRLAQLQQRTEQHLQHARVLAVQAEERLAEARQLIAECHRPWQLNPHSAS